MTPKELRRLRDYTWMIRVSITKLDEEMKKPSTGERGKAIAKLCNQMEFATESVQYHLLNIDYRTQKPRTWKP